MSWCLVRTIVSLPLVINISAHQGSPRKGISSRPSSITEHLHMQSPRFLRVLSDAISRQAISSCGTRGLFTAIQSVRPWVRPNSKRMRQQPQQQVPQPVMQPVSMLIQRPPYLAALVQLHVLQSCCDVLHSCAWLLGTRCHRQRVEN
jgi:hypothetical protein